MFRVYTCLTVDHAHFIAMLAYDPSVGAGYNLVVTILSLLIAVLVTGVGLGIALFYFGRWTAVLGGAVVGSGIAAMHYTGMMALEVPGRITWLPNLVVASVVLGIAFGAFSVFFAARRDDWLNTLIAIFLLTFAIVGMHFTGMGAVLIMPDPARVNGATSVSPASLSLVIASVAAIILGICLAVALSDRQSKGKLRQQKILLDTALENTSQGALHVRRGWQYHAVQRALRRDDGFAGCMAQGSIPARPV
jgi:NO-binding membrane sensor protein with MHYT domain